MWYKYVDPEEMEGEHFEVYDTLERLKEFAQFWCDWLEKRIVSIQVDILTDKPSRSGVIAE